MRTRRILVPFSSVSGALVVVCIAVALLVGCEGTSANGSGDATYAVTYDANGATSGTVPVDSTDYAEGDTVTVLGNSGGLAKSGSTFAGWNTSADGSGNDYTAGDTFVMGTSNVTLYAAWSAASAPDYDLTGSWDGTLTDTLISGPCIPASKVQTGTVVIEQNGTSVTIQFTTGFDCNPLEACYFEGSVDGNTVAASNGGVADGSGGTYLSLFSMTVAADGNSAEASGTSTYTGPSTSCEWSTHLTITRSAP